MTSLYDKLKRKEGEVPKAGELTLAKDGLIILERGLSQKCQDNRKSSLC